MSTILRTAAMIAGAVATDIPIYPLRNIGYEQEGQPMNLQGGVPSPRGGGIRKEAGRTKRKKANKAQKLSRRRNRSK